MTVRFDGDISDLIARLDRFSQRALTEVPKKIIKVFTTESEITKERMSSVGTGAFAQSLVISTDTTDNHYTAEFYSVMEVRARGSGAAYNLGYLLENGVSPHDIFPTGDWKLRFWSNKSHRVIETDYVEHPGFASKYYRRTEGGIYQVTWTITRSKIKYVTASNAFKKIMKETR